MTSGPYPSWLEIAVERGPCPGPIAPRLGHRESYDVTLTARPVTVSRWHTHYQQHGNSGIAGGALDSLESEVSQHRDLNAALNRFTVNHSTVNHSTVSTTGCSTIEALFAVRKAIWYRPGLIFGT
jgi:hypothetical protein